MSEFKSHLHKYAENELKLTGFDKTEFGKTTLQLLNDLADISQNNPDTMNQFCQLLPRLIDYKPLSPIT